MRIAANEPPIIEEQKKKTRDQLTWESHTKAGPAEMGRIPL
jgi:hypothetical protein